MLALPLRVLIVFVFAVLPAFPVGSQEISPDTVLARVDGRSITYADIRFAQASLPRQYRDVPTAQILPTLVDMLIESELVIAEARRRGLHERPEVKERVRRFEEQAIKQLLVLDVARANITDTVVEREYNQAVENSKGEEEIHTRHILVGDQAKAEEVLRILDGGADFAETAVKHSVGPTGPKGGDLGWTQRGMLVPEYENAAFALASGTYTPAPVKTKFGWHLIKLEGRRPVTPPSLEEATPQIQAELTREVTTHLVDSLRGKAKIERFGLDGKPLSQ